jgi:hypothetical protein
MDTGLQSGHAVPQSPGTAAQPVVLALIEDRVDSLASLLFAAEIATARQARLDVVYASNPPLLYVGITAAPVPAHLWAEADRLAADQLRDKVAALLGLASVEWSFTWTVGSARHTAMRFVRALSPVVVVVGTPRRRRFPLRLSLAQWLIGRPEAPAVVAPV